MSLPTTSPLPAPPPTSVFVDESGRRRARARVVARTIVGGAGIYVLIVIAGLTSSVSLPGAHLGLLSHVASGRAHSSRLGAGSKVISLPAALKRRHSTHGARPSGTTAARGGTTAPGATGPAAGGSNGTSQTTSATTSSGNRSTTSSPTPTSQPVTTTTKNHGPPTSTAHGPPSTKPGVGKGRVKP